MSKSLGLGSNIRIRKIRYNGPLSVYFPKISKSTIVVTLSSDVKISEGLVMDTPAGIIYKVDVTDSLIGESSM